MAPHVLDTIEFMSKQIEAIVASPWFLSIVAGVIAGTSVAQYQVNQHEQRLDKMDVRHQEAYDLLTRIDERVKTLTVIMSNQKESK